MRPDDIEAKTDFFNGIASKWDGWEDLPVLAEKLAAGLEEFGLLPDERVLDIGCGTGNLTAALLKRLSAAGRVTAVDAAPKMIEEAKRKISDPRVEWLVADAESLGVPDASFDRVFCFSVWPHISDPGSAAEELGRVLRPGGSIHIWHVSSRTKINEIHASADGPIHRDLLVPASETAAQLERHGFRVTAAIDDDGRYLVSAVRGER